MLTKHQVQLDTARELMAEADQKAKEHERIITDLRRAIQALAGMADRVNKLERLAEALRRNKAL